MQKFTLFFGFAAFYGFLSRLIADAVSGQSNFWGIWRGLSEFQTWGILALLFIFFLNKRYNLKIWESILLGASWPGLAFLAYTFEGCIHNIIVGTGLSYSLWSDFWLRLIEAIGFGAVLGAITYFLVRIRWSSLLVRYR